MMEMQQMMDQLKAELVPGLLAEVPLPKEKIRAARAINNDYEMMKRKLQNDSFGILLPGDREALALLDEERRRDLEALFSPEEAFEYEVRTSDAADLLRHQMENMELPVPGFDGNAYHRMLIEREDRMLPDLEETLGEERFRTIPAHADPGIRAACERNQAS